MPVSRIGTSSNKITYRPFASIAVALYRVTSPPGSPGSAGVTDSRWYTGPNAKKTPAAQAKAWATHADTAATPIDLRCPSVPSATTFRAPHSRITRSAGVEMAKNPGVVKSKLRCLSILVEFVGFDDIAVVIAFVKTKKRWYESEIHTLCNSGSSADVDCRCGVLVRPRHRWIRIGICSQIEDIPRGPSSKNRP